MHELGIIEQIVQIAEGELIRNEVDGPVRRLLLRVGKLSGASPEALTTAFEVVAPNTRLAGAELAIEEPPAICDCRACGAKTEVAGFTLACPTCSSPEIVLSGGRDLQLVSIDVDDEDA